MIVHYLKQVSGLNVRGEIDSELLSVSVEKSENYVKWENSFEILEENKEKNSDFAKMICTFEIESPAGDVRSRNLFLRFMFELARRLLLQTATLISLYLVSTFKINLYLFCESALNIEVLSSFCFKFKMFQREGVDYLTLPR